MVGDDLILGSTKVLGSRLDREGDRAERLRLIFDTAPFDRSGTSPSAIREGREVSRWRHATPPAWPPTPDERRP